MKSQPNIHTHCQVAQADTQAKTWQRVCLSHADKIELKKISSPSENKKYSTAQPDTTKTLKRSIDNGLQTRAKEGQLITAPTKNWRFSASYDSFVVKQTFVLRMNICGKNRQLLVAANR
jgi:hypothetical protein